VKIALSAQFSQFTVTPPALTFSTTNFSEPQVVKVAALPDLFDEGSHGDPIVHTVSSGDVGFNGVQFKVVFQLSFLCSF
jgi:hypothetical protein